MRYPGECVANALSVGLNQKLKIWADRELRVYYLSYCQCQQLKYVINNLI